PPPATGLGEQVRGATARSAGAFRLHGLQARAFRGRGASGAAGPGADLVGASVSAPAELARDRPPLLEENGQSRPDRLLVEARGRALQRDDRVELAAARAHGHCDRREPGRALLDRLRIAALTATLEPPDER